MLSGPYAGWGVKVYNEYQIIEKFEAGIELTEQEQKVISQSEETASAKSVEDKKHKKAELHNLFASKDYKEVVAYRLDVLKNKLWRSLAFWQCQPMRLKKPHKPIIA